MSVENEKRFNENPILNSPYERPRRHWETGKEGQPTGVIIEHRRPASTLSPIAAAPVAKHEKTLLHQADLFVQEEDAVEPREEKESEKLLELINSIRSAVEDWRNLPKERWGVTAETERLLCWWRDGSNFPSIRPFFCQVEAVETLIWLTEVAPKTAMGKRFLDLIYAANQDADPNLYRIALKLATGAGKTTVMAMIIAWQTINASRHGISKTFTKAFLITTPGITIRDRLRVLIPNDPDACYAKNNLVPNDLLPLIDTARVVITNYHAFMPKRKVDLSSGTKSVLTGPDGNPLDWTTETDGEVLRRVLQDAAGMKNVLMINDEAHHCYRHRPDTAKGDDAEEPGATSSAEEKAEAKENEEAARVWISGLEKIRKAMPESRVVDLSATPFFLKGSGYKEGTIFPWTVSDFSLMDALECGIVKLPRIPIQENTPSEEVPRYRDLWASLRKTPEGRKFCSSRQKEFDPGNLPPLLTMAIDTLYSGYVKTYKAWEEVKCGVPPCFIFVCQNTAISKAVYQYISGYVKTEADGSQTVINGACELFDNYDKETDELLARPRTILVDSKQLENGEALPKDFLDAAKDEIERFREEYAARVKDRSKAMSLSNEDLLREVMNTVGKRDKLGASVRCVVSVSMLTEGWDANTVTHILGLRAFGTQLLCEQVVGRALRRLSYEVDENNLFRCEYADIFGVPFSFVSGVASPPPPPPPEYIHVQHVSPERDRLTINFPRVFGYRCEFAEVCPKIEAKFTEDSRYELSAAKAPTAVEMKGIIGDADIVRIGKEDVRPSDVIYHLANEYLKRYYGIVSMSAGARNVLLFQQCVKVITDWVAAGYFIGKDGYTLNHLRRVSYFGRAALDKIHAAVLEHEIESGNATMRAILDDFKPCGSTMGVDFRISMTNKKKVWRETAADKCHVNYAVCDSEWELAVSEMLEGEGSTLSYVRNEGLYFEVPYVLEGIQHVYMPDFIVRVKVGEGEEDVLNVVLEVKGYRGESANEKKHAMEACWVPGVNALGEYGTWAFIELNEDDFFSTKTYEELVACAKGAYEAKLASVIEKMNNNK